MCPPSGLTSSSAATPQTLGPSPDAGRALWRLQLLGRVQADSATASITRWPSRATAALLARLALAPGRAHAREELVELLWPGVPLATGRSRLRQALSHLRSLLEPAGSTQAAVLVADRQLIQLNPGAIECDVLAFEQCAASTRPERAHALYAGELMPGFYDDWVVQERHRLLALHERLPPPATVAAGPEAVSLPAIPAAPTADRLPAYWTRAFGQDAAVRDLCAAVCAHRLVTLLGPGGNGKTRLAVAAARALTDAQPAPFARVVFGPLVDAVQPQQLWQTLSQVMSASGGGDARGQVVAALLRQHTLLVLDNVEQFDEDSAQALAEVLREVPSLHLLLTSRRRLGVDGERLFELPGLPLPTVDPEHTAADLDAMALNPAVSLFVDRARESRPEFHLTAQTVAPVVGLVRLLGGMPLAIELAASRLRALSPRELLDRLRQDAGTPLLDLLARPGATAGAVSTRSRHASMRHVVAWSWQQLRPEVSALLQAMSVFGQPASARVIAQAWAGLTDRPPVEPDALAAVQALLADALESSLITRSTLDAAQGSLDGPTVYALLQPVREFAAERTDPALAMRARTCLRQWLIGFARDCAARRHLALAEVEAELPQVCAAIVGGVADGAFTESAQLAVALRRHWEVDTRAAPPAAVVDALRSAEPHLTDPGLQCEVCLLLCFSLSLGGDVEAALDFADRALALAPDGRRRAQGLMRRAGPLQFSTRDTSMLDASLDESVALAREAGDAETEGLSMRMQFLMISNRDNDHRRAEQLARQLQALWERLGHRRNAYGALMDTASCWIDQGRFDEAATALATCEQVAREERFPTGHIMASWQLGRALVRLRRADDALAAFQRCVRDAWQLQRMAYVADALVLTPAGLALTGRFDAGALLLGFSEAHWQRHFGTFYRDLARDVCFSRRVLRLALGPARLDDLRRQGTGLSLAQAVSLALTGS